LSELDGSRRIGCHDVAIAKPENEYRCGFFRHYAVVEKVAPLAGKGSEELLIDSIRLVLVLIGCAYQT